MAAYCVGGQFLLNAAQHVKSQNPLVSGYALDERVPGMYNLTHNASQRKAKS